MGRNVSEAYSLDTDITRKPSRSCYGEDHVSTAADRRAGGIPPGYRIRHVSKDRCGTGEARLGSRVRAGGSYKLKVKSSAAVDPALRNRPCSLFERRGFKDVRALRS